MRKDDIPAMYNDLTTSNSQDSQELQRCFDAKAGKSSVWQRKDTASSVPKKSIFPTVPSFDFKYADINPKKNVKTTEIG